MVVLGIAGRISPIYNILISQIFITAVHIDIFFNILMYSQIFITAIHLDKSHLEKTPCFLFDF